MSRPTPGVKEITIYENKPEKSFYVNLRFQEGKPITGVLIDYYKNITCYFQVKRIYDGECDDNGNDNIQDIKRMLSPFHEKSVLSSYLRTSHKLVLGLNFTIENGRYEVACVKR